VSSIFRDLLIAEALIRLGYEDGAIEQSELSSSPNWKVARKWIRQCMTKHKSCSRGYINEQEDMNINEDAKLPTRVIDIGLSRNEEPRLIEGAGHNAEYVTLSHCWGKVKQLMTTSSNLEAHLTAIPVASLPKTFQDAVAATRELGFRYLWIDSLCIVQDSAEDWEIECTKMADIFRYSRVTLCGPQASDSSTGFLHPRTYQHSPPQIWEFRDPEDTDCRRATIQSKRSGEEHRSRPELTAQERESPLQHRGWILQEYLLSPRMLFFGSNRMYWECTMSLQFEDFPMSDEIPIYRRPGDNSASLRTLALEYRGCHCLIPKSAMSPFETPSQSEVIYTWFQIIQDYTKRSLSVAEDKLPAVSAIASSLFSGNGENYLAGLPKQALHEGLAWRVSSIDGLKNSKLPYRAPTWSWASTDLPVKFMTNEVRSILPEISWKAWQTVIAAFSEENKAEIHHADVKVNGLDPFGRVSSGSIRLRGRTKIITDITTSNSFNDEIPVSDPVVGNIGSFYPDDPLWHSTRVTAENAIFPELGSRYTGEEGARPTYTGEDQSVDQVSSIRFPPSPTRSIKCLCIDYFKNRYCIALAIEELPPEQTEHCATSSTTSNTYTPYRRIGIVHYWDYDYNPFEDASWEWIELF